MKRCLNDVEFLAYSLKDIQRLRKLFAGVNRCDDRTHAAFVSRHRRIDDTLRKNPLFKETRAEAHRQGALAHYHRRNWRLAVTRIEPQVLQAALEEVSVFPEALDQAIVFLQNLQGCDAGCYYRRWMGGAEKYRAGALQEKITRILAAGDIATQSANALGKRANL